MDRKEFIKLYNQGVILLDGGMGTMLQDNGITANLSSEACNLNHKEIVKSIHQQFVDAGSQIIQSNTFGGNSIRLAHNGIKEMIRQVNIGGIQLAKEASGGSGLVAGSMGPTGKELHPKGSLFYDEVVEIFYQQAKLLREGGADLIIIETMMNLREAQAAVVAVRKAGDLPIICTFAFNEEGLTYGGETPETVILQLEALGVDCGGINCTDPKTIVPLIKRMKAVSKLPLLAQPNAGLPKRLDDQWHYSVSTEEMVKVLEELIELGVNLVGGCCGTTPEMIREVGGKLSKGYNRLKEKGEQYEAKH